MVYYYFTNFILAIFLISLMFFINKNLKGFDVPLIIKILSFSLLMTLVFKYFYSLGFLGLEYEDSYVFNFSARQLAEGIYTKSFLTEGIVAGSLNHPVDIDIYGGHFITYPTLISWFFRLFGYSLYIPSYINTLIEFLTILTLSISFKSIFKIDKYWYIPGVIYSMSPIMNVFANTQLSETFSSFIVLLSIMSLFYFFKTRKKWDLLIFGIFFFTALMTKRENTVIFNLIFTFSLITAYRARRVYKKDLLPIVISIVLIIFYLFYIQNIFLIEKVESVQISTNTFSLYNFINLIPVFFKAYFDFTWYTIIPYLLIAAISYFLVRIKVEDIKVLSLIVLFISYLIIYTVHYRSYYFVTFNKVDVFEALRYMNNFYIIITLIISSFIIKVINNNEKIVFTVGVIVLITSSYYTFINRANLRTQEWNHRFSSPVKVLSELKNSQNYVIITDVILVFQLLGDKDLNLIDLNYYKKNISYFKNMDKYIFMTNFSQSDSFKYRYKDQINTIFDIPKKEIVRYENNDVLFKILN